MVDDVRMKNNQEIAAFKWNLTNTVRLPHSDTVLVWHEQGPEFQPQHLRWPSSRALASYV